MTFNFKERKQLITSLIATYVWGLLAHGYAFLNLTISHDSLMEYYLHGNVFYYGIPVDELKAAVGRFLAPVYQLLIRGTTVSPWFSGMLALLWLSLAVWMAARIFRLDRTWQIVLLSGILTVNMTVIALTGTYLHDLDVDMLAVFFAVSAVYFWTLPGMRKLWAIPCLVASMGIYQSQLSVMVSLVMVISICRLLEGEDWKDVFFQGLLSLGLMGAAAICYVLLSNLVCRLLGIGMIDSANGIANLWGNNGDGLLSSIVMTYYHWAYEFFAENLLLNLLVAAVMLLLVIQGILRPLPVVNKLLALLLGVLLPFGMNLAAFLNHGDGHLLMGYAFWFVYLLLWLLGRKRSNRVQLVCTALVFAILFSNVRIANRLYTKKHLEREATLSLMTRVIDRLEHTEGYRLGETTVYFLGAPKIPEQEAFAEYSRVIGAAHSCTISEVVYYQPYFDYILQYPIRIGGEETYERIQAQLHAEELEPFPAQNSIAWVDDVLVVKMREAE